MAKRYVKTAIVYAVIAMVCGVFFREFTKYRAFEGSTKLSLMHAHYFMLGMMFFLVLMLLEKNFSFSSQKGIGIFSVTYQIGLNITGIGFFMRGLIQVLQKEADKGLDASVSGIAGIGHIIMGISLVLLLFGIKKAAALSENGQKQAFRE